MQSMRDSVGGRLRRFPLAIVAVYLLFSLAAQAEDIDIRVVPDSPTPQTPVTLQLGLRCPAGAEVTREQKNIRVAFHAAQFCGEPPFVAEVPLGLLPAGEYNVEMSLALPDGGSAQTRFVVRNEPRGFAVHPTAFYAGSEVPLRFTYADGLALCGTDCSNVSVTLDGQTYTGAQLRRDSSGGLWVRASMPRTGLYDVTVRVGDTVMFADEALYAFGPNGEPDLTVFERVLFPLLFDAPGAHGSEWRSEASISNPRPWHIDTFNNIFPFVCVTFPCGERLHPGSSHPFTSGAFPKGVALLVPRAEARNLAFSLRVRDVSREAQNYGTEVPVVREAQMARDTVLTLLDVPRDPRFRAKLRIYALEPFFDRTEVHVAELAMVNATTNQRQASTVTLSRDCTGMVCDAVPAYAEVDLPAGAADEYVNVYVKGPLGAPTWAFVTVTNNETQEVTIVSPDGAGGVPCAPCLIP